MVGSGYLNRIRSMEEICTLGKRTICAFDYHVRFARKIGLDENFLYPYQRFIWGLKDEVFFAIEVSAVIIADWRSWRECSYGIGLSRVIVRFGGAYLDADGF